MASTDSRVVMRSGEADREIYREIARRLGFFTTAGAPKVAPALRFALRAKAVELGVDVEGIERRASRASKRRAGGKR